VKSIRQEKICDLFRVLGWTCAYITLDDLGNLEHYQSSGEDYCQWGHYLSTGHYDWFGKEPLTWRLDRKTNRGHLYRSDGKEVTRWASFTAIILFPTKFGWFDEKKNYRRIWNGKPPQLWWRRERADHKMYDRREAERKKKPWLNSHFFIHSYFLPDGQHQRLGAPKEFEDRVREDYESVLRIIQELSKSS